MRTGSMLLAAMLAAAADGPGLLVSTGWLAENLGQDDLVVLHVGARKDYDEGHIPGARLIELSDISATSEDGLRLELPPAERLREAFSRLGISDSSRIVVYAGTPTFQSATRVFFTLDYLGLAERTALLDGGLGAWRAEGRALTTETALARRGNFTPRPLPDRVADAGWINRHNGRDGVLLLDARTPEFYTGASPGAMPRAGHIPGARNIPYPTLVDADGRFKNREQLAAMFEAAGARSDATVVTYCHIGHQATALYFAARYLGYTARLYDGSFQDWSRRPELPVELVSSGARDAN